jgi:regulator of nucleoside diphosphate kinase
MNDIKHVITDADRRRVGALLITSAGRAWGTLQTNGDLESLLEEASSVHSEDAPQTLVTMNSRVALVDLNSGRRRTVTLVYPQDYGELPNAVSVTEPLGAALFGCRVGDVIEFRDDSVDRSLRVAEVLYQPEHAGAHHL